MIKEVLQNIGLTKGETEVYLTLLKVGNTSSGTIIRKSRVSRSKVYDVLERLKQKGLVTEIIKQNVKHFEATSPKRIMDLFESEKKKLKRREMEAKKIVPQLINLQKTHLEKQEARVYMGVEGWKALYNEILNYLNKGDEYLAFGIGPEDAQDKRIQLFFRQFHIKRAEKKVKARLIMRPQTKTIMKKKFSDLKYYDYRFLNIKFPTNINIHKDRVVILVWGANPVGFLINSKQVANKYKEYFEEMWRIAKNEI